MEQFETIYRRHASAVFRFAWGLCGNRSCAEDLVSETFVRLLTKAPRIRTRTALAYLLAVARARARNKLVVIGMGIGLTAIVILTALGGALLVGLRTFGKG